ncbi:MAG: DUF1439 domain-containing protein [Marinobacterium sp.]|nr:DUF1439 domain-containing protein [Marinobacterium sp.]
MFSPVRSTAIVLVISSTLLLSGCQYTGITETRLNQQLSAQLVGEDKPPLQATFSGLALQYQISDVQLNLEAAAGGQVVTALKGTLQGELELFGRSLALAAPFEPQITSGLNYVDGQMFLSEPRITDWGRPLPATLQPWLAQLETSLTENLTQTPVYQLDNSLQEQLMALLVSGVEVQDDRLAFQF